MDKKLIIENIKTPKSAGLAIRRLRKKYGLSQTDLAKKMNIRQATISDIENGRGTMESFFKMIQILKVNLVLTNQSSIKTKETKGGSKAKEMIQLLSEENNK